MEEVLKRLAAAGLRLKRDKCIFYGTISSLSWTQIDAEVVYWIIVILFKKIYPTCQQFLLHCISYFGKISHGYEKSHK